MLIALFSQYMSKIDIAVPGYSKEGGGCYIGRFPMFKLFPVSISNINKQTLKTTKLKRNQKYSSHLQGVVFVDFPELSLNKFLVDFTGKDVNG